ncbi:14285_t:CDS:2, partial [Gigaspora rosea]
SRNDLPDYNNRFEVKSTDDGSLLIMSKNKEDQYKSIRVLLPNGHTIDIELNFLDKNITRIFPLTMQYYLLLYYQKINSNMQISGIVLDYDKKIIKEQLGVPNVYAINNGNFHLDNSSLKTVFPMVDGNYGFIIDGQQIVEILDKYMTNVFIYYKSLNPITRQISENSLLYYAQDVIRISNVSCSSDYSEYGNVCVLTESTKKFANYKLWASLPSNSSTNVVYSDYEISDSDSNYTNMTGSVFRLDGTEIMSWSMSQINQNKSIFHSATFNLMKNNTYLLYVNYSFNEWDIFSINLPPSRKDSGYKNPNIISTYPAINDNITISDLNINITFSSEISISSNNLTIYYLDTITNTLNFRKFYSKNSECNILFNNTLSCNVTSSIFNQWNATYIIVMDNNFVKFSSTNEPMYGIEEYLWKFTTVPCPQHSYRIYSDTAIGTLQLTMSDYIKEDSISNFLIKELAESIPINPERLKFTDRLQSNSLTSPLQYIIQLKISSTQDYCQASYLDSSYGFRVNRTNVALLEFLTSNFAGFPTFNAPFSKSVKCWIYWITIINTFINNIPQLVIHVLYFRYTVEYKAIPFLTLLVSAISLLNDIILKLFKFFGNQNKSDNEDKHLYDNYTNDNIQLENGENDNEENNNRESSTFIHNEDQ